MSGDEQPISIIQESESTNGQAISNKRRLSEDDQAISNKKQRTSDDGHPVSESELALPEDGDSESQSEPEPMEEYGNEEIMDPDGDLYLRVGPTTRLAEVVDMEEIKDHVTRFRVCSITLRRASPVFKKMLFGPWMQRKPADAGKTWEIALPEHSNQGMSVLLAILHGHFHRLPRCDTNEGNLPDGHQRYYIDTEWLHDILEVADFWGLHRAVQPFLKKWITYASNERVRFPDEQRWMIKSAWLVGDETVLGFELHTLAMHSWLDADGDLICTAEEREGWSWGMSMDVIYSIDNVEPLDVDERDEDDFCVEDLVKTARNSALQTLLDFHRAEISKRRRLAGECDALVLGMLQQRELRAMQPFQRSRLWKKAEDIPGYTVSQVLRVLEKRIYSEEFPCHDDSHETCGPIQDFQKLKSKLLDDVEYRKTLLFTDEMREDAKRQRVIWFGTENPE